MSMGQEEGAETSELSSGGRQLDSSAIVENEIPGPGLAPWRGRRRWPQGTHDQVTRQFVAFGILGLLAVLYFVSLGAFILGFINQEGFVTTIAAISGPQALAAAVIGFYYGKKGVDG